MNNLIKRMFGENVYIIAIPALFVILLIVAGMLYGFADPRRVSVTMSDTLLDEQIVLEDEFLGRYRSGSYSETSPFFQLNPYGVSPLTGVILFRTETVEQYVVVVNGKTADGNLEYVTKAATSHQIPVLGLYAGYTNKIQLYRYDPTTQDKGELLNTLTVQTDPLPQDMPILIDFATTKSYFGDDWMVLMPDQAGIPIAFDAIGNVRWYLTETFRSPMEPLANGHYLVGSERLMLEPYSANALYEIDLLGKIHKQYYLPGGAYGDVAELPSGNLLILTNNPQLDTVEDRIVEVSVDTGEVVKVWDMSSYFNRLDGSNLMWTIEDWFHASGVTYDPTTDSLLVASRHKDAIVSIDYTTDTINWILGDPDRWRSDLVSDHFLTPRGVNFSWFFGSHGVEVLPNGMIATFDNGNNRSKLATEALLASANYSRAVVYDVDPDNKEVVLSYAYGEQLGSAFYSPYHSNVAFYDVDHFLIHSGGIGNDGTGAINQPYFLFENHVNYIKRSVTQEVKDGVVAFQMTVSANYATAIRITPYTEATRVRFGTPVNLGSQYDTFEYDGVPKELLTVFHNVPLDYQVDLTKQSDRLVLTGQFSLEDEVYLILANSGATRYYHVPTDRHYLSSFVLSDNVSYRTLVTFYVNEYHMSGTYRVYVMVNGHRYDTYKVVTFD